MRIREIKMDEERGNGEARGRRNKLGLIPEVMNDRLPRLAKFIPIFMVKIVWMFFNF
jgi:hypothetical protein